ncbi:hypothetical protein WJX82_006194 [Trebouxia sp. C0006]
MPRALWFVWAAFIALTAQAKSETFVQSNLPDPGRRLKLLYVVEYDGKLDWQPVQLEKGLTDDLLAWLINLHDRLTMTSQQYLGEELMIPATWWGPEIANAARSRGTYRRETSMKETIRIPGGPALDDLSVTTVKTFWQVAEATAAAGSFIYREDAEEEGLQVQSLRDYVVAIPTMNAIHGQDTWGARHVSDEYADHSAWDVHTIIEILRKFFDASEGTSLPELAEYNWRLDKEIIHNVFQDHYHKDP